MTRTQKTNPAYAFLAYRRAILKHVCAMLVREYCSLGNEEPDKHIYSDEVFLCDREVPMEDISTFIEELTAEDARLLLEMNKFEFRAQETPALSIPTVPAQCMAPPQKESVNESTKQKGAPGSGFPAAPPAGKPGGRSGN